MGVVRGCPLPEERRPLRCKYCRLPHEQRLRKCRWYKQMNFSLGYTGYRS